MTRPTETLFEDLRGLNFDYRLLVEQPNTPDRSESMKRVNTEKGQVITQLLLAKRSGGQLAVSVTLQQGSSEEMFHIISANNVETVFYRPARERIIGRTNLRQMRAVEITNSQQAYVLLQDIGYEPVVEKPESYLYRTVSELRALPAALAANPTELLSVRLELARRIVDLWTSPQEAVSQYINVQPFLDYRNEQGKNRPYVSFTVRLPRSTYETNFPLYKYQQSEQAAFMEFVNSRLEQKSGSFRG